jgi:mutator protein MutT
MAQKQITIVTAVIRNEKGEALLAKRHQPETPEIHGMWEFVGGGINFGETPANAIIREIKEEIGVEAEIVKLLPEIISDTQKFESGDEIQFLILSYECKIISGEVKPTDTEIAETKFVPLNEVKNYKAFNNIYQTINFLNK